MSRAIALLAGTVAYLAAWFLSTALPTPLLWHFPLEHRFSFETHPLGLGADFYGRLVLCLAAFAVTFGAVTLSRAARVQWLRALSVWAIALLLFTSGMYLSLLAARRPMAAPLPDGYVAR